MKKVREITEVIPIYKIENDCILSKQGDITVGFEVTLPEIFTLSGNDFEAIHHSWVRAIKLLPNHTVLHKQDWFVESRYQADFSKEEQSFLSRASERHFNERPYLDHRCYLFLTKKAEGRKPASAMFSNLIRPTIVPPQTINTKLFDQFMDKVGQFCKVLQDGGLISVKRLNADELAGTDAPGLLERYCYLLSTHEQPVIRDMAIGEELKIGNLYCQLFTLADAEDLPAVCGPRINYDRFSTDKTKFSVCFAAPLGQLLSCNHIYNQYVIVDDAQVTLKKLEGKRLRLQSLSAYSRDNSISKDATNNFLNEAIAQQRLPVKAHFNLLTWTEDKERAKDIKNMVSAALAQMDARTKQESVCAAQLYWAGLPGNEADLLLHETFDTFAEQATCFFNVETSYKSSISPVGIRLGERLTGLPLHVDISDEPMKKGICTNRNKFVLGPSPCRAIL